MKLLPVLLVTGVIGLAMIAYLAIFEPTFEVPGSGGPSRTAVFEIAAGTWAWADDPAGCDESPRVVTFSEDLTEMRISYRTESTDSTEAGEATSTYDILGYSAKSLRGVILGETRMTETGEPVVWDLVLRAEDRFAWHRTDWDPGAFTGDMVRCPPLGS